MVVRRSESNSDYHGDQGSVSKTGIWVWHTEGAAAFHRRFVLRSLSGPETSSLAHGTLLHRWLEVGDSFWGEVSAPPTELLTATGAIGKEARAWGAANAPSCTLVSPKELAQLHAEVESILANPAARDLIASVHEREVSIRWDIDGFPVRCRPDAITHDGVLLDLKTTKEIDLYRNWWKAVKSYGYYAQDWLYQRGYEAMAEQPAQPIHFVVVSTTPPHECLVCTLPRALTSRGGEIVRSAIADLRLRLDTNCWTPDQHGEVVELPIPGHAF